MKDRITIYSNVKHILTNLPTSRDNNNYLWYCYTCFHVGLLGENTISQLYIAIEANKMPSFETLARFSRDIQFKYPELRGKEWETRQRKQVKAKEDLGYK